MEHIIPSNEFWGGRSGSVDEGFGKSTSRTFFQNYFQQMQWKPSSSGNSGKTGWKARKAARDYKNSKLNKR